MCRAAVLLAICAVTCGCGRELGTLNGVGPDQVATIVVQTEEVSGRTPAAPEIPPFVADLEDHGRLLALVQQGTDHGTKATWIILGFMRVHLRDGREVKVRLFWTGGERGAYAVNDRWYRGSSDAEIIRTVTECAKRGKAK